jgi:glycosyltransferase involved in cell wall biosynthesis
VTRALPPSPSRWENLDENPEPREQAGRRSSTPMPKPRIGVVVPTLNSASTLPWTLLSLRSQRDVTVEIILADSGSQDGTLDICKSWGVETIYVPPGNMYRAINAGLRQMGAEWVTYLNSDDIVYPQSYARLVARGEQQRASLVYGDCDFVDYEGRFLFMVKSPPPRRLPGMVRLSTHFSGRLGFAQPAAIYRRSAFQELGGFDERYSFIADYDFFFRLVTSGRAIAKLERPPVVAFRLHPSQRSQREAANVREELRLFRKATNVGASLRDLLDVLSWRLQNLPIYVWRLSGLRP